MDCVERRTCRACGGHNLAVLTGFGDLPLANALFSSRAGAIAAPRYPLGLMECTYCGQIQLSHTVSPSLLYANYPYESGVSQTFWGSCQTLARKVEARLRSVPRGRISGATTWLDIGCNDGTLFNAAHCDIGSFNGVGVDPSPQVQRLEGAGHTGIQALWTPDLAKKLRESGVKAQIVTAQNVLAHTDDWDAFFEACTRILAHHGLLVLEFPWAYDTFRLGEFDQIYHEHLSYILAGPLSRVLDRHGFYVDEVEELPIHGGSLRVWCNRDTASDALAPYRERESRLRYDAFLSAAQYTPARLVSLLAEFPVDGAIGAAAKGTVMANVCGLTPHQVCCIVDDTSSKQGLYQAGTGIPIISRKEFDTHTLGREATMLVFAWNFLTEIQAKWPDTTLITPNPPRVHAPLLVGA